MYKMAMLYMYCRKIVSLKSCWSKWCVLIHTFRYTCTYILGFSVINIKKKPII